MNITLNNGENLYYEKREGGEHVILLIHGNMASSAQWDLLMEQLDPAFTVYAVDLRGYGESSYHQPVHSIRDFSEDVKQLVDQLALQNFMLIGWSNGGGVAMQFAANYPEYIHKMILLSSISTRGFPAMDIDGKRIQSRDQLAADPGFNRMLEAQQMKNVDFFRTAMDQVLYSANAPSEERYQKYLTSATQQRNMLDAAYAANKFNISMVNGTGEVRHISVPVLVLWGERDRITTNEMTMEIIEDFQHAAIDFVYSPIHAGHALLVDNITVVLEEIYRFSEVK
ncbi:intracellular short-chain-length polyhydroxyalkanoate depolymerase [Gracilibacillus phocaeensis]|uniref:intracellular short-chain-length polyhydroxyalkanoate depolymerase n=1 Tax=Gracilibacillus phocaeensis TaxID=2042304 RepID=UPI001030B05F|nr:alpha/beta hydrolase [Gracilibacillus phocaeensis]